MISEKKESQNWYRCVVFLTLFMLVCHLSLSCMHAGTMWISIHPDNRVDLNPFSFVLYNLLHLSEEHVSALMVASTICFGAVYCSQHWSKAGRMFGRALAFAGVYYIAWSMMRVIMWLVYPDMIRDIGHALAVMYFYLLHPSMMQLLLTMVIIIVSAFQICDKRC